MSKDTSVSFGKVESYVFGGATATWKTTATAAEVQTLAAEVWPWHEIFIFSNSVCVYSGRSSGSGSVQTSARSNFGPLDSVGTEGTTRKEWS